LVRVRAAHQEIPGTAQVLYSLDLMAYKPNELLVWFHFQQANLFRFNSINIHDNFDPVFRQLCDYVIDELEQFGFTVKPGIYGVGFELPINGMIEFLEWDEEHFEYVLKE
ncbi:MAG TPA: hypothetical protein VMY59_05420, partial [Candidatus Thermoplasmatota archaeon]|nr:hypothetical protein [Candidatus Thermoplasmatota archaeon]